MDADNEKELTSILKGIKTEEELDMPSFSRQHDSYRTQQSSHRQNELGQKART